MAVETLISVGRSSLRLTKAQDAQLTASAASAWLTGHSASVRNINRLIDQVAAFDSNVLILGESGTGKEVVARAVHAASPRHARPFIPINCGAIPSELLESELFGHEKGAFTGALNARKGRFELAEGGTIFLDEIGDMNPTMQVKLLRVLQERVYERVGSCVSQRCDVRIVAATHRNLEEAIAKGTFREDLFYRLNVVPIDMPPLRDRQGDLPLLINDLVERVCAAGRPRVRFSAETLQVLAQYRWPGNVRELGNLIERLSIQCADRTVTVADLPQRYVPADWSPTVREIALDFEAMTQTTTAAASSEMPSPAAAAAGLAASPSATTVDAPAIAADDEPMPIAPEFVDAILSNIPGGFDLRNYLESLERQLIERALQSASGTVAQAARLLGLRRTTLVEKLRKYSLTAADMAGVE
jgi:sigma-54 specific flagellar transcriptional regulator A